MHQLYTHCGRELLGLKCISIALCLYQHMALPVFLFQPSVRDSSVSLSCFVFKSNLIEVQVVACRCWLTRSCESRLPSLLSSVLSDDMLVA